MDKQLNYGDNITIEQAKALFFDQDAILIQPRPVYRMDNKGRRFYFTFDAENKPKFYISVTSFINASLPTPIQLIDWIAEHGRERANEIRDESASYGTLLHKEIAQFLIHRQYNLDRVSLVVEDWVKAEDMPPKFARWWVEPLKRDMAAFAQFCCEVDFKPLAIEMILTDDELNLGGAIDIVGDMNIEEKGFFGEVYKSGDNAGKPKETKRITRVRAILDVKSGRKGFYESHELQLRAYRKMWNNTFPDHPVLKTFNWAPKEWRENPSYSLKDQTDTPKSFKFDHLLKIAQIEASERDSTTTLVQGMLELGKSLEKNVRTLGIDQVVLLAVEEFLKENAPEETDLLGLLSQAPGPDEMAKGILDALK